MCGTGDRFRLPRFFFIYASRFYTLNLRPVGSPAVIKLQFTIMMKRIFKSTCVVRIALFALLSLCCVPSYIMAQFSGSGSGTEDDPYRIFNAAQLNQVRNFLNKSNVYFSLEADIDLTEWIAENNPVQGWSPIGSSSSNSFRGTFNGNGHTISGLWIKRPDTDYVGLFGYVYYATVSGVRLYGAEIEGKRYVGGISGYCDNLRSDSYIRECIVEMCTIKGNSSIGGIAGYNNKCYVECCYFNGKIYGDSEVGGIVGTGYNIENCYVTGYVKGNSYVGGICGSSSSTNYCYVNCERINGDSRVAGISNSTVNRSVAINGEISANSNLKRVTTSNNGSNNLAWVQTSMVLAGEKLPIPQDDAQNGTNTGLSTLKLQATYEGLGWDFTDTWAIQETESLPYLKMQTAPPYFTQVLKAGDTQLSGQCAEDGTVRIDVEGKIYTVMSVGKEWSCAVDALRAGDVVSVSVQADGKMPSYSVSSIVELPGSGTEDDPYLVSSANDLQAVTAMKKEDAHYLLTNDIDLTDWITDENGGKGWIPVGGNDDVLSGTFDGGGHTVSGLWTLYDAWQNGGLFAGCAAGGIVKELNVVTASGGVSCSENSGGIAGSNAGTIMQCTVKGKIGDGKNAGGIAGRNTGSVIGCRFAGEVTSAASSSYVGGIIGYNTGTVTICKSEGGVSSAAQSAQVGGIVGYNSGSTSVVSDCESLMAVEASGSSAYGGGVAGYNYGSVTRCIASGDVTGYSVAGVCGYNSGSDARVTACVAANRSITATKGGLRVLGGYSSDGQTPGMEDNYALKTMAVSVNGVPQVIYDDPVNGTAKSELVLKGAALYKDMDWDMDGVWGIDEGNTFPYLRVHFIMVSEVDIDTEDVEVMVGDSLQLTAVLLPDDATNRSVSWSSSKPEVAEVTEDGKAKALSVGTAVIRAVAVDGSGASDSCCITVNPKKAENVTIDRTEVELEIGSTCTLNATAEPEYAADRSVTWTSSDESVATVDAEGVVTAVSIGTATVTATTNDGTGLSASCMVTVKPKRVESISLDREELTMDDGTKERLTVTVLPENATDRSVTWTSSDESVVTVDAGGVVTAMSVGTATVTATTNDGTGLSASCMVTVMPKRVESISLDREELTMEDGTKECLTVTVLPDDATDRSVTWTSSDESVATVDAEGVVTAVSIGTATVTATTNDGTGMSASCMVTVTPKYARSISLNFEKASLDHGFNVRLIATVLPEDATDRSVTWTSSDEGVATVDAEGVVTAVSAGTATVTATTNDGSDLSASCIVEVFGTTAIDDVADDTVSVYGHDGEIVVDGLPEGTRFYIYDVAGRTVYYGSDNVVRVTPRAYYLVQIGENTYKVYVP